MVVTNVTVAYHEMHPYVSGTDDGQVSGLLGEVWLLLATLLNLSCNYVPTTNFEDGHILLAGAINNTPPGYLIPVAESWYSVFISDTGPIPSQFSYLNNWSFIQWVCAVSALVIYSVTLYIILHVMKTWDPLQHMENDSVFIIKGRRGVTQWHRHLKKQHMAEPPTDIRLSNCFLSGLSVLSNQGTTIHSSIFSVRLSVLTFLFCGMIFTSAFSARLVSQFTKSVEIEETNIKTMVCMRENSIQIPKSIKAILRSSCRPFLCSSKYALLEPLEVVETWRPNCSMYILRNNLYRFQIAAKIVRDVDSQIRHDILMRLSKLREVGLLNRFRSKWLRLPATTSRLDSTQTVDLEKVSGLFVCLLGGIASSCIILIIEQLWHRHQKPLPNFTWND